MAITGEIQGLYKDREHTQAIFPMTKVKAVTDDNGVGLNVVLAQLATKDHVAAEITKAQFAAGDGEVSLDGFATEDYVHEELRNYVTTTDLMGAVAGLATEDFVLDSIPSAADLKLTKNYIYSQTDANGNITNDGISSYPTAPGVYRITYNACGCPGCYGSLVIFYNGGYILHIFVNHEGMWFTRTENTYTPSTWNKVAIAGANGTLVDTNTTYSLTKSGSTITLTGSDGSSSSVSDSSSCSISTCTTKGTTYLTGTYYDEGEEREVTTQTTINWYYTKYSNGIGELIGIPTSTVMIDASEVIGSSYSSYNYVCSLPSGVTFTKTPHVDVCATAYSGSSDVLLRTEGALVSSSSNVLTTYFGSSDYETPHAYYVTIRVVGKV